MAPETCAVIFRGSKSPSEQLFETKCVECREPQNGEITIRVLACGYDPLQKLMLGMMKMWREGEPPQACSAGVVEASQDARFPTGTYVQGMFPWQTRFTAKVDSLLADPFYPIHPFKFCSEIPVAAYATSFGVLGETAYMGLKYVLGIGNEDCVGRCGTSGASTGAVCAKGSTQTLLVTGATGGVGRMAVQIVRLLCSRIRVVGVGGSAERLAGLRGDCDAVVSYGATDLEEALRRACPNGIDYVLDLTGGPVLDASLRLMNRHGKIAVAGVHGTTPYKNMMCIVASEITIQGYGVGALLMKHGSQEAADACARAYMNGQLSFSLAEITHRPVSDVGRVWNYYMSSNTDKLVFDLSTALVDSTPAIAELPAHADFKTVVYTRRAESHGAASVHAAASPNSRQAPSSSLISAVGSAVSTQGAMPWGRILGKPRMAIIGAFGNIGKTFTPYVISRIGKELGQVLLFIRNDTRSRRPGEVEKMEQAGACMVEVADFEDKFELCEKLRGVDFVVSCVGSPLEIQKLWADAAVDAGVKRFIPSEYGVDTDHSFASRALAAKKDVRNHLEKLASTHPNFCFTSIFTGGIVEFMADYPDFFVNMTSHKAELAGDPSTVFCMTRGETLGKAIVGICSRPREFRNANKYVFDYVVKLSDIVKAIELTDNLSVNATYITPEEMMSNFSQSHQISHLILACIGAGAGAFVKDDTSMILRVSAYVPEMSFLSAYYKARTGQKRLVNVGVIGGTGTIASLFMDELLKGVGEEFGRVTLFVQPDTRERKRERLERLEKMGATVELVKDFGSEMEMSQHFHGHDLIMSLSLDPSVQKVWIDAAVNAGVRHFIPSEFGIDNANPKCAEAFPAKGEILKYLDQISKSHPNFSYTPIFTGFVLDHFVAARRDVYGFKDGKVEIYGDVRKVFQTTTSKTLSRVVRRVCSRPEDYKNRHLHIFDYTVSPQEMVEAIGMAEGVKYEIVTKPESEARGLIKDCFQRGDVMGGIIMTVRSLFGSEKVFFARDDTNDAMGLIHRDEDHIRFEAEVYRLITGSKSRIGVPTKVVVFGVHTPIGGDIVKLLAREIGKSVESMVVPTGRYTSNDTLNEIRGCGGKVVFMDDLDNRDELRPLMTGCDAVISFHSTESQMRWADVAAEAGCKMFIPAEFGCDTDQPLPRKFFPTHKLVAEHLETLERKHPHFKFCRLFTGVYMPKFISYRHKSLGFNKESATAELYGEPSSTLCASWPQQISETILILTSKIMSFKPQKVYMYDYFVSLQDVVDAFSALDEVNYEIKVKRVEDGIKEWEKLDEGMERTSCAWRILLGSGDLTFTADDSWSLTMREFFRAEKGFHCAVLDSCH